MVAFCIGWHYGYHSHVTNKANSLTSGSTTAPYVKHRALVGAINKVSSSQIDVTLNSKQNQSATITSSTVIRNTKGQTVTASTLQTGNRVIVTTTIDSGGSLTANNILVTE